MRTTDSAEAPRDDKLQCLDSVCCGWLGIEYVYACSCDEYPRHVHPTGCPYCILTLDAI